MKNIIIGFSITGVLIVFGITLFLISQKDESKIAQAINEDPPKNSQEQQISQKLVKTGSFNYLDPLHFGEGKVEVIDLGDSYKIKMHSDFKSADAPDPHVYLSTVQDFKDRAIGGVDTSKTINLGKLKSFTGEQEYLVSKSDFESHDMAVIIWCKKFGVQISRADLK